MKKFAVLWLLLWLVSWLPATEILGKMIAEKKWNHLAPFFADASYLDLQSYFQKFHSLELASSREGRLVYKAKTQDCAEIGNISFARENGLVARLKIEKQIAPVHFIDSFKKYVVENLVLHVGKATLLFDQGSFYQAWPARVPLLYEGRWRFQLSPDDEEESLTLERLFKSTVFSQSNETGIFVLQDLSFLEELPAAGAVSVLETQPLLKIHATYLDNFGITIQPFTETCILPYPDQGNLLIFARDKDSYYLYDFNGRLDPDTQLRSSDGNRLVISTNTLPHQPQPLGAAGRTLRDLKLSLYCNPEKGAVSGTAHLEFADTISSRTLNLARGLKIRANIDLDSASVSIVRKNDLYHLLGPESNRLTLYYSGQISLLDDYGNVLQFLANGRTMGTVDLYYFLSRNQNFYPNPGNDFFASRVTVNLPAQLNCLASGVLLESKTVQDRKSFQFESPGTKGVSLVSGDFKRIVRLPTKVPVNVYASGNFHFEKYITLPEMTAAVDFLVDRFGMLDMPEINVLFRRMLQEGGISHQGFVILNIVEARPHLPKRLAVPRWIRGSGPLFLSDSREDHFLHELAHQWWGGVISWESERDIWITEGFATFASLLYLQKKMTPGQFASLIGRLKQWIFKHAACGPLVYGQRIANLEGTEAFQSVVYLKSALVLLMLRDLLGEENFFVRVRGCLQKFKYHSVTSTMWIDEISGSEEWLPDFFRGWVYSRKIPRLSCQVRLAGRTAELEVTQQETAFVFPLQVRIETEQGVKNIQVLVRSKKQTFRFLEETAVKALDVEAGSTPILIDE